jgi:hypothetical protein
MAAVILSTVVVLFATNITANQVQKEKMYIASSHVWYINSTTSIAALGISNTGPTDVVITKLNVKGLQCEWNGTSSYVICTVINGTFPGDLPLIINLTNTEDSVIQIGNQPYNFTLALDGLMIKSGYSIAFYAMIPNKVMIYDLSTPITMMLSTAQAVYCTETLVQTA